MGIQRNNHSIVVVSTSIIIAFLLVMGLLQVTSSYKKNAEKEIQIESLNKAIEEEKLEYIELKKKYENINTREYIERIARLKLGLIYPDEILIETTN